MSHPGDAFSFDIFSQAGRLIQDDRHRLLGDLTAKKIIAVGESQSAIYLTSYVPAIDPIAKVFDGFLLHSRFGIGAPLDGQSIFLAPPETLPRSVRMPAHTRVPVLTFITETDLIGVEMQGFYTARQPDGPHLRVWEVAGTSHADSYALSVGALDSGREGIAALAAAYAPTHDALRQHFAKPINPGFPHHYVVHAALASLNRWVTTGIAPTSGAPLIVAQEGAADDKLRQLAVDAWGNALGGIRTPWVDVPAAQLGGTGNSGGPSAWLMGVGQPFEQSTLKRLYPGGRSDYLSRFEKSLDAAIHAGFILAEDRREILDPGPQSSHLKTPAACCVSSRSPQCRTWNRRAYGRGQPSPDTRRR